MSRVGVVGVIAGVALACGAAVWAGVSAYGVRADARVIAFRDDFVPPDRFTPVDCPEPVAASVRCWEVRGTPEDAVVELVMALEDQGAPMPAITCTDHEPLGGVVLGCLLSGEVANRTVNLMVERQWRELADRDETGELFTEDALVLLYAGPPSAVAQGG